MPALLTAARWLVAAYCCVCALSAQSVLSVTEGPLTAGKECEVRVEDPNRAGLAVLVEISDGDPLDPVTVSLEVVLDENGLGSASWIVPGWLDVYFDEAKSNSVHRRVTQGSSASNHVQPNPRQSLAHVRREALED